MQDQDTNEAPTVTSAARALLWKLSHNEAHDDGTRPARIDRRDITVRDLAAALDALDREAGRA